MPSQPLHEFSDYGDFPFIVRSQNNRLVGAIQGLESDLEVSPGGGGGGLRGGAFAAFYRVAGVGFGVGGGLQLDEQDAAFAGAGDRGAEDAPGSVGDTGFHGFRCTSPFLPTTEPPMI